MKNSLQKVNLLLLINLVLLLTNSQCKEKKVDPEKNYNLKKAIYNVKAVSRNPAHLREMFKIFETNRDSVSYYLSRHLGDSFKGILDSMEMKVDYPFLKKEILNRTFMKNFVDIENLFPDSVSNYFSFGNNNSENKMKIESEGLKSFLSEALDPLKQITYDVKKNALEDQKEKDKELNKILVNSINHLGKFFNSSKLQFLRSNINDYNELLSKNYAKEDHDDRSLSLKCDNEAVKKSKNSVFCSSYDDQPNSIKALILKLQSLGITLERIEVDNDNSSVTFRDINGYINDTCLFIPTIRYGLECSLTSEEGILSLMQSSLTSWNSGRNSNLRMNLNKVLDYYKKLKNEVKKYIENEEEFPISQNYSEHIKEILCKKKFDVIEDIIDELDKLIDKMHEEDFEENNEYE